MIRIFCSLEVPASPTKTLLPQESGKQLNLAGKRKKTKWRHVTPHRYRVAAMELYKLLAGAWTESHRPPHHLFHKWCPQRIWHHGFGWGGYDIGGPGNVSTLIRTETRSTMERDCIVSKSLLQTLCWQQFGILIAQGTVFSMTRRTIFEQCVLSSILLVCTISMASGGTIEFSPKLSTRISGDQNASEDDGG